MIDEAADTRGALLADVEAARSLALAHVDPDIAWHVFVHLTEQAGFRAETREQRLDAERRVWAIIDYISLFPGWTKTKNLALSSATRIAEISGRRS